MERRFSTFGDVLAHRADLDDNRTAFTYLADGSTPAAALTYGDLDRRAQALAAHIQALAQPGDRALLVYEPGLEFVVALGACFYAGVAAVPTHPPRAHAQLKLAKMLADSDPAVIMTTRSIGGSAGAVIERLPEAVRATWLFSDGVEEGSEDDFRRPTLKPETLAVLQYTSGSTSDPRAVMVTHGNLLHNSEYIRQAFELDRDSVSVSWLPSYHDMGLIDGVLQPLYSGFPAYLMPPAAFLRAPILWLEAVTRYRVTHSGGPNFAYALCVRKTSREQRESLDLASWRTAYNGAEPIRVTTLREFQSVFAPSGFRAEYFYPCYGLAEATLMVTGGPVHTSPRRLVLAADDLEEGRVRPATAEDGRTTELVSCGRTHLDTALRIVDPQSLAVCPPGRVGEIWVSGGSVASGYWNRADETAQVFDCRTADAAEGPFLRTGDLGFVDGDELYVTGRLKDLIIVRGRNLYPQDIERTVEESHPAMRPGCGVAFAIEADDEEQLVIVQEIREEALERLDVDAVGGAVRSAVARGHEVLAAEIVLVPPGTVPKTSSGKVQRARCRTALLNGRLEIAARSRRPGGSPGEMAVASTDEPQRASPNELKAQLVEYLRELISSEIGPWDPAASFWELGLDSLRIVALQHRLMSELGADVSLGDLLENPTVEQLAEWLSSRIEKGGAATPPSRNRAASGSTHALSHGQRSLWFLHELAPESAAYNVAFAIRIDGDLDVDALCVAFGRLVERHAALRTTVLTIEGRPQASVRDVVAARVDAEDATHWSREAFDRHLTDYAERPFDLASGPLLRALLCRRGENEHVLLLTAHHIVVDRWSLRILLDELWAVYAILTRGELLDYASPEAEFSDYVDWQAEFLATPAADRAWSYWEQRLDGAPTLSTLPLERPRPEVQTFRGSTWAVPCGPRLLVGLRRLAKKEGVTLYMLLLAAFQVLLHRYSGEDDIVVGTTAAGRARPEFAGTVGYLANQLALRADLSGDPRFRDFLGQVRRTVIEALKHQDLPFPLVVERLNPERDPSHSPIFQTMFLVEQQLPQFVHDVGLTVGEVAVRQRTAQFDLTLKWLERDDTSTTVWEYNSELLSQASIQRVSRHYQTLLRAIVDDSGARIGQLDLLSADERRRAVTGWNDTPAAPPNDSCLHQFIEAQAARTPDAVGVAGAGAGPESSYSDLDRRANQLAHRLVRLGVGPGVLVGVCLRRSPELLRALLAVLKSGGAFVPLDPSYPRERLAYLIKDSGVAAVLTEADVAARLPETTLLVRIDADRPEIAREHDRPPTTSVSPVDLAYVIYTSGSTGRPKGVKVSHRAIVNYLTWCLGAYGIGPGSRVPVSSSIAFDATMTSLLAPLLVGGSVVLLQEGDEIGALRAGLTRGEYDVVKLTPAYLDVLRESFRPGDPAPSVATLVVGGEAFSRASLERWRGRARATRIFNEYGPTEAAVACCAYEVPAALPKSSTVPIGRPITNVEVYVLDRYLQPVPIGVVGEIHVGGVGLADGYLGRPDLTAERFIRHPFRPDPAERLYRTGDLARYLPDGTIEYLGRADGQLKVRGIRVEPEEVEAVLLEHPSVRAAAVGVVGTQPHTRRLVAYVVADDVDAAKLRELAAGALPQFMVPSSFVFLPALPMSSNGKVDRRAVDALSDSVRDGPRALPSTDMERAIASVWAEVLGLPEVGTDENLFELGGNSLLAAEIRRRLADDLGRAIEIVQLFQYPTISSLASHLESRPSGGDGQASRDRGRLRRQAAERAASKARSAS